MSILADFSLSGTKLVAGEHVALCILKPVILTQELFMICDF